MGLFTSGRTYKPPVHYLFVDGAYLRNVLQRKSDHFFDGNIIELNYQQWFINSYTKIFYYDCLPPKKASEDEQTYKGRILLAEEKFDALRAVNGCHVFLGTTSSEGTKSRQKGVDIMIAVHMLTHSFRGNMEQATLLAGDADFKPLVDSLIQDGMNLTILSESKSTSKVMKHAADAHHELDVRLLMSHATDQFKARFSVPMMSYVFERATSDDVLVRLGKANDGTPVELYQSNGRYLLSFAKGTSAHYLHVEHASVEMIEKLMVEMLNPITWE